MSATLAVSGLSVAYVRDARQNVVVHDVSFDLEPGRILGLAGESGCGKSTAALTAIGFPVPGGIRLAGSARLGDVDLLSAPRPVLRKLWGREVAYVAQDASGSLSPLWRVGRLLQEPLRLHLGLRGDAARRRSLELLEDVGIPDPETALRRYPHQFSGGQQQRIALAIAMSCRPRVLVLDEPTTGLDVTTQAQITRLIRRLVDESGTAALSVSHDLALLAQECDDLAIMYAGEIVERGPAVDVFDHPRHPYARALLDAAPRVDEAARTVGIPGLPPPTVVTDACPFVPRCRFAIERCSAEHPELRAVAEGHEARCLRLEELGVLPPARPAPLDAAGPHDGELLLEVAGLRCTYLGARRPAVDDVRFEVRAGETLAVVGESGSGKSTALRAIAGLHAPDAGELRYRGQALPARAAKRPRAVRRAVQIVFQDPTASLNPRHTVRQAVERPLQLFRPDLDRRGRATRLTELLADVRLDPDVAERRPHELSGGQKQRVALARAFAADPELILCDEVVSALDVSVQASILDLLARLAADRGTALLFVTHDLAVVRSIADRVCVMRDGQVVEEGPADRLFTAPEHEYTRTLLAAVPRPHASLVPDPGAEAELGAS